MKHLNEFLNEAKLKESNEYVTIKEKSKTLEITISKGADIEEMQEIIEKDGEDSFYEFFEPIRANSSFEFISNISDLGHMTEAPGIVYEYDIDDNGDYIENEYSILWYYPHYQIKSFVEELLDKGKVVFVKS